MCYFFYVDCFWICVVCVFGLFVLIIVWVLDDVLLCL